MSNDIVAAQEPSDDAYWDSDEIQEAYEDWVFNGGLDGEVLGVKDALIVAIEDGKGFKAFQDKWRDSHPEAPSA